MVRLWPIREETQLFIRKLYYDLISGETLASYMRQGDVIMTTFAEDVAALPELAGRAEVDTGCMVWTEFDSVIEEAFAAATGVSVDVAAEPHQIVFDYTPLPVEPDPMAEMEAALNELGVTTRE